jgi:hypothetical protein
VEPAVPRDPRVPHPEPPADLQRLGADRGELALVQIYRPELRVVEHHRLIEGTAPQPQRRLDLGAGEVQPPGDPGAGQIDPGRAPRAGR